MENLNQSPEEENEQQEKLNKKQQFLQIVKFTAFSLSAGAIQLLSFAILYNWTKCLPWWPAYLISIVLSVVWNFTFNRKFTFKAANNVPLAMALVVVYYAAFIPVSVFGGGALEKLWGQKLGNCGNRAYDDYKFCYGIRVGQIYSFQQKGNGQNFKLIQKKAKSSAITLRAF